MKKIIVLFVLVLTAISVPAQYSSEYNRVVRFMKNEGWSLTADHMTASSLEYAVVAFSDDDDVLDVDVEITDLYGNEIASDTDEDDWGIATLKLSYSRTLRIRMTNYSSNTPYFASRCRYVIFYR